ARRVDGARAARDHETRHEPGGEQHGRQEEASEHDASNLKSELLNLKFHETLMRRVARSAALGIVTVSTPSFRSAVTMSTSVGSGSANARENRPWPPPAAGDCS